jgi:hypothetical protein
MVVRSLSGRSGSGRMEQPCFVSTGVTSQSRRETYQLRKSYDIQNTLRRAHRNFFAIDIFSDARAGMIRQ